MSSRPFHLAFPVYNIESTRDYYTRILGCSVGRESEMWIDFNLYGHQVVAHLSPDDCTPSHLNYVDGDEIPVRHFGVILDWDEWENLCDRIEKMNSAYFIKPRIRFRGKKGEQATFFILDPSGNALEFKAFKHDSMIFAKELFTDR